MKVTDCHHCKENRKEFANLMSVGLGVGHFPVFFFVTNNKTVSESDFQMGFQWSRH